MPREAIEGLAIQPGHIILDGTLGGGGHTRLIAQQVGPNGCVVAVDRDPVAVARAETTLRGLPVLVSNASYAEAAEVLAEASIERLNGILLDLGLSSDQLEDRQRGFSFHARGPLDLRFDPNNGEPATKLIARLSAEHLADLIYAYGEERCSRRIAAAIVDRRRERPIQTSEDLADIIRRAVPKNYDPRIDPATRTFQALRIAVNSELDHLERALQLLPTLLAPGGRFVVISFHSLEDRLVKVAFRRDERLRPLASKPLIPTAEEIAANPRSRSAKLRVAERC
ncbi:Ribosomal RNA small subunit methyltransferase H [Botrimarina hoheduenensis]|uniref:Ribosomal RNA small subunit methyltransferase H n=2 Tax=Botrimarina hoheduenensis TaxID=2528000 RepID=A0A5C5VZ15_9BACT|nr:Ribosomal RNA small subunit methyltransferase H [Botrimarina hoheduenensis]